VRALMTFLVCDPETLIIATPEIPGPEESAKIVINYYYNLVIIQII
jgi:hypothetical protein